jgi:DNA-binding response OmpR family regulator
MNNPCELHALLLSSDPAVVTSVVPSLQQLGITSSVCRDVSAAIGILSRQKNDAFFVDRELDPGLSVLAQLRKSPSNRSAIAFAIVRGAESAEKPATRLAEFVLEKPLTARYVNQTVRAAYGMMLKERRRYFRHAVRMRVDVVTDSSKAALAAESVNLSQTGLALECNSYLVAREIVQLRFQLPTSLSEIRCSAQVIWTADSGKAGLVFTQIENRDKLTAWLEEAFYAACDVLQQCPEIN